MHSVQSELEDLELQKKSAVEDERYDDAKQMKLKIENLILTARSMGKTNPYERPTQNKYEDRKIEDPDLFDQQQFSQRSYYRNLSTT